MMFWPSLESILRDRNGARLSPWVDEASRDVAIDKERCQGLSRSESLRVIVHPGAVGLKWFQVERAERCKPGAAR